MKRLWFKALSVLVAFSFFTNICLHDMAWAKDDSAPQATSEPLSLPPSTPAPSLPATKPAAPLPPSPSPKIALAPTSSEAAPPEKSDTTEKSKITSSRSSSMLALSSGGIWSSSPSYNPSSLNSTVLQSLQNNLFSGNVSFSLPVAVPAGRRGVQPSVSLTYTSQKGNTTCGIGWEVTSSSIQRSTKRGIPKYDDNADTFVLFANGGAQELVKIASGEYRFKIESAFSKITYSSGYWLMTDKGGNKYYFGETTDSKQQNTRGTFSWHLCKQEDAHGNTIEVAYVQDEGQIYPFKIQYSGNEIQQDTHAFEVAFILETRTDKNINYVRGAAVVTGKRVKEIQVKVSGEPIYKYALDYTQSSSTSRSLLTSFQLKDPEDTALLPAVTPSYQVKPASITGHAGYSDLPTYFTIDESDHGVRLADLNGDGLTDFVWAKTQYGQTYRYAWLNNGNGWTYHEGYSNLPTYFIVDNYYDQGSRLVDVNGDGRADFLWAKTQFGQTYRYVWLNTGSGWQYDAGYSDLPEYFVVDYYYDNGLRYADLNGDGLTDLIWAKHTGSEGYRYVWLNTGSGWQYDAGYSDLPTYFIISNADHGARLADVNGDGLADFVWGKYQYGTGYKYVWLNTGAGWQYDEGYSNLPTYFVIDGTDNGSSLVDLNGDGLVDFVQNYKNSSGTWFKNVWLNTGSGWQFNQEYTDLIASFFGNDPGDNKAFVIAEINGDTLNDFIWSKLKGASTHRQVWTNGGPSPDLLAGVDNGIGGSINVSYTYSTQFDNTGTDEVPDLPFQVPVLQTITSNDGQGNEYTTAYEYANGSYSPSEREFRGFGYVKTIDAEDNYSESYFKQDDIYKGVPYKQEAKDASGNLYVKTENTLQYTEPHTGVYFPYISQVDSYTYDGDEIFKQTQAQFQYDSYGNPTQAYSLGDVSVSGDEKKQITEYVYNTTNWIVSTPKHAYLLDSAENKVSEKWFYYDNHADISTAPDKGLLTKEEVWLYNPVTDQQSTLASQYAYDAYGNLTTVTDPLTRTTTTAYDQAYHIYPVQAANDLGHAVKSVYYGINESVSDGITGSGFVGQLKLTEDPNSQKTYRVYDAAGRVAKAIGPNDTEEYPGATYAYDLSARPIKITQSNKQDYASPPGYLTGYEFFDGLNRSIQVKSPAENDPQTEQPRQVISGIVKFDTRGKLKETYLPYFVSASSDYVTPTYSQPHSSLTYDCLGRLIRQTNPDDTFSTIAYSDRVKTFTDENNHFKTLYQDAYGQVTKVEEHNQSQTYTTTYAYDTQGNLVTLTDDQANVTRMWYDSLGRKVKMDDPDMGIWLYEYDNAGNLTKQTDAKSQVLEFTYDHINRLTQKKSGTTILAAYQYDDLAKDFCIGRLSLVTYPLGSTEFFYDALGREIKSTKQISGSGTYSVERTYDALDRLVTLQYPDSFSSSMRYEYNPRGIERIAVTTPIEYEVVSNIDYAATGQITHIAYGNGSYTDYTYHPQTLRLSSLLTETPSGRVQDFSYSFDNVGNVTSLLDYRNSATQSFTYDDLNRLTQAQKALI